MTDFNEKQLEQMLCEHLSETTLTGALTDINPFREAVSKVIAGLVLTTFTLQFLYLNYILPTIGVMLIYLGMRTLRSGNGYFRGGWLLSLLRVILVSFQLLVTVTPYSGILGDWSLWLGQGIHMGFLFCLGMGIRKAGLQAGLEHPKMATWPVMVWQVVFLGIAMVGSGSWTILILLVVSWINLVRRICRCADDLETVGYGMPASPVWFSAKPMLLTYLVLLVIAMTGLSLMANYTPVDAETVDASAFTGATESASAVRRELIEKGFPEEMLSQILDEDLEDLGEVKAVICGVQDDTGLLNADEKKEQIRTSTVAVCTADHRMKLFSSFTYLDGKRAGIRDCAEIIYPRGEAFNYEDICGRIFFREENVILQSRLLIQEKEEEYLWFGDISRNETAETVYSFPPFSKEQRGYLCWWIVPEAGMYMEDYDFNVYISYYLQKRFFILPYADLPYENTSLFGGFGDRMGEYRYQIYPLMSADYAEPEREPYL